MRLRPSSSATGLVFALCYKNASITWSGAGTQADLVAALNNQICNDADYADRNYTNGELVSSCIRLPKTNASLSFAFFIDNTTDATNNATVHGSNDDVPYFFTATECTGLFTQLYAACPQTGGMAVLDAAGILTETQPHAGVYCGADGDA